MVGVHFIRGNLHVSWGRLKTCIVCMYLEWGWNLCYYCNFQCFFLVSLLNRHTFWPAVHKLALISCTASLEGHRGYRCAACVVNRKLIRIYIGDGWYTYPCIGYCNENMNLKIGKFDEFPVFTKTCHLLFFWRCSQKTSCPSSDAHPLRYVTNSSNCPAFASISPKQVPYGPSIEVCETTFTVLL